MFDDKLILFIGQSPCHFYPLDNLEIVHTKGRLCCTSQQGLKVQIEW